MDFSSLFLDPPTWNQQEISDQGGLIQTDPLQIQPPASNESDTGSTRPVSMVDRARQAQLPLPEAGLKCPRCDSSNTKFCYFNNYNLSQPRHFCKGCRRYWTRGGALRNIPVGGGCRRNKRTKSRAKSKSDPVLAQNPKRGSYNISSSCLDDNNNHTYDLSSQLINPPPSQPDPFVPGYWYLNGFGLNLRGHGVSEQLSSLLTGSGLTGNGLYPFSEGTSLLPDHNTPLFGRVKMDENQNQNLPKNLMLNDHHHHQYSNWGINPWTDVSGFQGSSSSSGRLL